MGSLKPSAEQLNRPYFSSPLLPKWTVPLDNCIHRLGSGEKTESLGDGDGREGGGVFRFLWSLSLVSVKESTEVFSFLILEEFCRKLSETETLPYRYSFYWFS